MAYSPEAKKVRYSDKPMNPLLKPFARRVEFGSVPKKKPSLLRRYASKLLDKAANGIIRGTGSKPAY